MVVTRSVYQQAFQQEAHRLSHIELEPPTHLEFSIADTVYRPTFLTTMEEQFMNTLAKEQIKTLSKFGGGPYDDVIKWLQDVETVFDRAQLQPSNKLLAVQSYLTDAAAKWFRYNKSTIIDWSTFKIAITNAYQPSLNQILLQMEKRQQLPDERVMEYYVDKLQLCLQADPNMSSTMIIHYLIKGLNNLLIPHVIRRHPSTPNDFLTIAQDEEKIQLTLHSLSHVSVNPTDNYLQDDDPINQSVNLVKRPDHTNTRSYNLQRHRTHPPPLMNATFDPSRASYSDRHYYPQNSSSSFASRQCYECYRFGHIAKYCPNRKNI